MGRSKPFSAILFDLDGTLIDSRVDLANAVNFSLVQAGMPPQTEAEITPRIGNGLDVLLGDVMGPVSPQVLQKAIVDFSEFYEEHCLDITELYPGVNDFLNSRFNCLRFAVVTNKPERFAAKIVKKFGLDDALPVVLGGDTLPEKKPHPAPVIQALDLLGCSSEEALMVGDGVQDILAAQHAGVRSCLAQYGFGYRVDSLKLNPTHRIRHFSELKEIVL